LLEDLLERARAVAAESLTLEVRVANFAAQALYRAYGFRLAGLRRGYYRDTGEDALVMAWRAPGVGGSAEDESGSRRAGQGARALAGPSTTSNPAAAGS
jgi:hypothetical protein